MFNAADATALHARSLTPAYLHPRYDTLKDRAGHVTSGFASIREEPIPMREPRRWNHWAENLEEEDEFVSVEKVNGSYVIRTSPHPFRPERGNFKKPRERTTGENTEVPVTEDRERVVDWRAEHMAKFTYFLNPASRPELMNYKMSRKDKKHSETYYERMKRKQGELESSITTITTLVRRGEHARKIDFDRERIGDSGVDRSMTSIAKERPVEEKKRDAQTSKLPEHRRDSRLLRKIREKSAQRRKKLAPAPSSKPLTFAPAPKIDYNGDSSKRRDKTEASEHSFGSNERLTKCATDVRVDNTKDRTVRLRTERRTFLITKVDDTAAKCKSVEVVYAAGVKTENVETVRVQESSLRISNEPIVPVKVEIRRSNERISYRDRNETYSQASNGQASDRVHETSNSESTEHSKKSKTEESMSLKPSNVLRPNKSFLYNFERSKTKKC